MSRKDYEAIAAAIADTMRMIRADVEAGAGRLIEADAVAMNIADDLASYFSKENPRFDRDRFMVACDVVNLISSDHFVL